MLGVFFVIIACFLWALDSIFRYPLLKSGIDPVAVVFFEHLILGIIFIPYLFKNRKRFYESTLLELFYFLIIGVLGSGISMVCFTKAFTLLNPSLVILLQKFQPIIAILLAHWVLNETIGPKFLFWAGLCLVGAILISMNDLYSSFSGEILSSKSFKGYILVFISIISWGTSTVFGKKLTHNYTNLEIMAGRFTAALMFLFPFVLNQGPVMLKIELLDIGKICFMVLFSGLLAMYFYYKGLKQISAKTCALVELFFPFSAVIVNWLFLNQTLTEMQIIGGVFLMIGSTVVQLKRY